MVHHETPGRRRLVRVDNIRRSPRTGHFIDLHRLDVGTEQVAAHHELLVAGMPRSSISHCIAPGGRWQRLHPGVVLMHRGTPVTPARILEDEEGFVQDLWGLLRTAQNRQVPAGWTARRRLP